MVARSLAGKVPISSRAKSGNVLRIGGVVVGPAPGGGHVPGPLALAAKAPIASAAKAALSIVSDPPSTLAGTQLTIQQVLDAAYAAVFTTEASLLAITCIAIAESSLWSQARNWHPEYVLRPATDAIGVQGPANAWNLGHTQQMSSDRGIWQISSHSWPQYTDSMCDSPTVAATGPVTAISANGTDFTAWGSYNSGAAQAHYDAAVGGWPAVRPLVQAFLAAKTPNPPGVDLTVTALSANLPNPIAGEPITFSVTVTNNAGSTAVAAGRASGQNIGVGIYLDGAVSPITWTNFDGGLAAGASFTLDTVSGWAPGGAWSATEGTHTVRAWVNDQATIPESNSANNTRDITLVVGPGTPPPPPPAGQFFVSTSTWNTPLGSGRTFTDIAELHNRGWFNTDAFGVSLIVAKPTDPLITIRVPQGSWGWDVDHYTIHCPITGQGATGSDGSMCIIDGNEVYDFWQFHRDAPGANTGSCSAAAHTSIVTGTGWALNHSFPAAGIHAVGSSCLAGLIINNELTTGIGHTVAIATRYNITAGWPDFVGEAISADGSGGPVKEGMRLGIPPGVTMPGGLNVQEQTLWTACQVYGGFVVDVAGGTEALDFWGDPNSVPSADVDALLHPPTYDTVGLNAIANALRVVT